MGRKDEQITEAWRAITRLFLESKHQQRFHEAAASVGLTPAQLGALFHLDRDEPQPVRNLRDQLHCDASFATTTVDGLERLGYVERRTSSSDRRVKLVHLTAEGDGAKDRAVDTLMVPPAALSALTTDEVVTLRRLLEKAVTTLDGATSATEHA